MKIQKFKTIRILITALMFLTGTLVITSGAAIMFLWRLLLRHSMEQTMP